MELINFDNCDFNIRHCTYAGNAGNKDGILYNNENWIIKYPKSTKEYKGKNLNLYTTSPLSEYIGSHIYSILGFDVHDTLLGIRNNKLVVACKDFRKDNEILLEMRTIKNGAAIELNKIQDEELPISATGDSVNLEELLLHFSVNPLLNSDSIKEFLLSRFWECAVVDIFINNNDRNNGNWGVLRNITDNSLRLAPVFDNGNSFYNKHNEFKFKELLKLDNNKLVTNLSGNKTVYTYKEHSLNIRKLLSLNIDALSIAILRVAPLINEKLTEINDFIEDIPLEQNGYEIIMPSQKEYYKKVLTIIDKQIIMPKYEELVKNKDLNLSKDDIHYKRYSQLTKHKSAIDRAKSASKCAPTKNYNINKDYR